MNQSNGHMSDAHKAAAFEWLRYLPDRTGTTINDRDAQQAEIALRAWEEAARIEHDRSGDGDAS